MNIIIFYYSLVSLNVMFKLFHCLYSVMNIQVVCGNEVVRWALLVSSWESSCAAGPLQVPLSGTQTIICTRVSMLCI